MAIVRLRGPRLGQLQRAEDRYSRRMSEAIESVLDVAARAMDESDPVGTLGGIAHLWRAEVDTNLRPELGSVWVDAAADTRARLQRIANRKTRSRRAAALQSDLPDTETPPDPVPGSFIVPAPGQTLAEAYLATRDNMLVNVGDDVWELAREQLLIGMELGESIPELRDRVRESAELSIPRATTVARTEVVGASNAGSYEQMLASGLEARKVWLATSDDRTRDDHIEANGQTVGLREPFIVGGAPMQRPHDSSGPAREVVNCRCTITYEFDDNGLAPPLTASGRSKATTANPGKPGTLNANGGKSMAFSKVENHPACGEDTPWAVVDEDEGTLEGCFETEQEADEHISSLDQDGAELAASGQTLELNDLQFAEAGANTAWSGTIVVEGTPTGDGREFAPDSFSWAQLPIPLRRNIEDSHGGEPRTTAVLVGRIDEIERSGSEINGRGVFDMGGEHGREAERLVREGFLRGISVDADDITEADIEIVMPEDDEEDADADPLDLLFRQPERVIYHKARIRAATLVDIPAFVEASVQIDEGVQAESDGDESAAVEGIELAAETEVQLRAVRSHDTATSDQSWDGPANEAKLPSPMPVATARAAYAWLEDDAGDEVTKNQGRFIHHEVNEDGTPGAANLTACSTGIGVLNGGRGGTTIPAADRQGVYNHLAAHLRDADREPPPLQASTEEPVTASARVTELDEVRPPREWFNNPKLSVLTPIVTTDAGRIYGHAAPWGECHIGMPDVCVTAPFEDSHPYYLTGEVVCDDGTRVAVGQITVGTGHASPFASASRAVEHYDNTGAAVADVVVGNDDHGIWVAGAIRPGTDPRRVRELRAAGEVSGDWRRIGGQLRLVGLLAVNVPGFPVPKTRARVASGAMQALVAAGRMDSLRPRASETEEELDRRALKVMQRRLMARVLGDRKEG